MLEDVPERQVLEAALMKIDPILRAHGFQLQPADAGVSSGGQFATVRYLHESLELGLIVRDGNQLGCPNYSAGKGYAGHNDLVRSLDHAGTEHLIPAAEGLSYQARVGGSPFDALQHDLEEIILPALVASEARFLAALAEAVAIHHARLGFTS
jgi:hypothetical protein